MTVSKFFEELYPIAVESGIDADRFWDMDLLEIMTQIKANEERRLSEWKAKAYMDHRLSELVAYAVNDPAKMPKIEEAYPFVQDDVDQITQVSPEESDWKKDQALFMKQAQRIRQFNEDKKGGVESES